MGALGQTQLYAAARRLLGAGRSSSPASRLTPGLLLGAAARDMRRLRDLPPEEGVGTGRPADPDDRAADDAIRELSAGVPGFSELLHTDDALGRLCQALNEPALAAAYRATVGGRKFEPVELPAVTQLFTPDWVVRFLLDNTLGRLWLEMHPDSRLGGALTWLVPLPDRHETPARRLARELTILDPACGTMNFGLAAADLLAAMYREEQDRAGRPGWPAEPSVSREADVPAIMLRHNLFGTDIDPLALDLGRRALGMKFRRTVRPGDCNLSRADWLLDESPPDWPGGFDVIATNPPYLSARNLPAEHVRQLKARFPTAWRDACACFLDRAIDLLRPGGRAGFLAIQSILFTGSYEALRSAIVSRSAVEALAHFGPGLFGVGNPGTLQTAGLILRREESAQVRGHQEVTAFRLVRYPGAEEKRRVLGQALSEPAPPSEVA